VVDFTTAVTVRTPLIIALRPVVVIIILVVSVFALSSPCRPINLSITSFVLRNALIFLLYPTVILSVAWLFTRLVRTNDIILFSLLNPA
jgi:hypothetical protein